MREDFIEMMRHKDDCHTLLPEPINQLEQAAGFVGGQGCGGFVKDQNTAVAHQGTGNFDKLAMRDTQAFDRQGDGDVL
jgi:hypothetical protein